MSFVSFRFWVVLPIIFIVYWFIPSRKIRFRNLYLLVLSLFFYVLWKPVFALILLYIILITYFLSIYSEKVEKRRLYIWGGVVATLLPLLFFKYFNFIGESLNSLLTFCGIVFPFNGLNWAIPIGISFYSFQAVGYFLDVCKEKIRAERNFLEYALFISFFPQVVSGPISKGVELLPQIKKQHQFEYHQTYAGLKQLIWGLFLKIVIADRLGMCVNNIIYAYSVYSGFTLFCGTIFYSLQIYCDFAGYSFMAIGAARLFGFDLINNFRQPYFSISVTDFWRRWHISLSRWLKDYVYIPLGGSHCSKAKNYWNILVTFIVSGLWHGANWTFVIWGLLHGVVQAVEKMLGLQKSDKKGLIRIIRILMTFLVVNFIWVFFRMPSLEMVGKYFAHMFSTPGFFDVDAVGFTALLVMSISLPILLLYDLNVESGGKILGRIIGNRWCSIVILAILIAMVLSVGVLDSSTFIYANF